ncbi:D-alanine--D-alanine ligase [Pelosinus sp. IPA-1]|uniref:D-alanine--D-alanine ligase n=1 Tax=Pelosinus sp. IPA-1 TaxID=3029569 RepID=UPI00243623BC|nr:D-alanine--D-alanine ligase [Pelosinus sp. IPA-1]GMA99695.1 D-alanine--D-alanine ligase [Pelosinus sp. IPA-1]
MKDKKIAVVMGGPSAEREVSLNTGKAILAALKESNYNAVGIDLEPTRFVEQLTEEGIEVVFNAVHGQYGEDGILQGALELLGISYTGSGVLSSAMAMDKGISKRMFLSADIPTPRSLLFTKADMNRDLVAEIVTKFSIPVVVKSSSQGSSIGVVIVEKSGDLVEAVQQAFKYSDTILIEEFVKGRELTVAVWGNKEPEALPIIEIVPHSGRYDYHSKYTSGATEYIVPAELNKATSALVQKIAIEAFLILGCSGIARVDIMLDSNDKPYVLEVNTIPGMTATSLVPKAAAAAGIKFPALCERLLCMVTNK